MKNVCFLVLAMLCLSMTLQAQMQIGVQIGSILNTWRVNEDYEEGDWKVTNGFSVGIPVHLPISDQLSVVSGYSFMRKGAKLTFTETIAGQTIQAWSKTKVIYGILPLTLQYYQKPTKIGWYARGGMNLGYAFAGKIESFATEGSISVKDKVDLEFKEIGYKRFEVSALLGLGHALALPTGKLLVEASYDYGLTNLSEMAEEEIFNNSFQIAIGYFHQL